MEKYIYIKRGVANLFTEFLTPLLEEEYDNLGSTYQDYLDDKWVLLSDEQVAFLEENPKASVKEVWDMHLRERTLDEAKTQMLRQIERYDRSSEVNNFKVNDVIDCWFTPAERANYKNSIDAAKLLDVSELSMYIGNLPIQISTIQAEKMLAAIQLYADACYNVTKSHKIAVENLETIEEVDNYDYTVGYPEQLNFEVK